jgi:penicillin-insensitive murein DD-endopeptidase
VSPWHGTLGLVVGLAVIASAAPTLAQNVCDEHPSAGRLQDGAPLVASPYLRIKRGSEARVWGHSALIALVHRGARDAAVAVPGSVALVGDLSAREGGPLPGHVSHQAGLDADVALFVADLQGRPVTLEAFETFGADGRSLANPDHVLDVYRNWLMLRAWLSDLRVLVSHVFIAPELRQLLLDYGRQSPEFVRHVPLAAQVLIAHPTHADHFHLRITCPETSRDLSPLMP